VTDFFLLVFNLERINRKESHNPLSIACGGCFRVSLPGIGLPEKNPCVRSEVKIQTNKKDLSGTLAKLRYCKRDRSRPGGGRLESRR
jgi:hypothetical protein